MATAKKKPTTKTTDEAKKAVVESENKSPEISAKDYEKVLKDNVRLKDEITALKKRIADFTEQLSLFEKALSEKSQECERLKHRTFWQRLTNKTENL